MKNRKLFKSLNNIRLTFNIDSPRNDSEKNKAFNYSEKYQHHFEKDLIFVFSIFKKFIDDDFITRSMGDGISRGSQQNH